MKAIRILKEVDLICAEDTRTSKKLLDHYLISKPMMSYHNFNEHEITEKIISKLQSGTVVGLISDSGTPGISDPGYTLITEAIKNNIDVECLPGPGAFVPALIVSGFPFNQFVFEGFLPHKKGRQTRLKILAAEMRTIVFYESPFRIIKLLKELSLHFGNDRQVSLSRELTKKFEETFRGSIAEAIQHYNAKEPKGEFVVCIRGIQNKKSEDEE